MIETTRFQMIAPTYGAKVDRLLLWIAHEARYPGMPTPSQPLCGIAARIALPSHALTQLIDLLSGQQMLSTPDGRPESYSIRMFSSGWERVDALQHERAVGTSAFVAMSFADELRSVFDEGIRPALEECRYSGPFRVDDPGHESPRDGKRYEPRIDDRIMAGIRQARVLIVDVTGCRPAVYFEAGFATGLGVPIVWTCREGNESDMTFDTRQIEHILWKDPADLKSRLVAKLTARGLIGK